MVWVCLALYIENWYSVALSSLVYRKPLCILVSPNVEPIDENMTSLTGSKEKVWEEEWENNG